MRLTRHRAGRLPSCLWLRPRRQAVPPNPGSLAGIGFSCRVLMWVGSEKDPLPRRGGAVAQMTYPVDLASTSRPYDELPLGWFQIAHSGCGRAVQEDTSNRPAAILA